MLYTFMSLAQWRNRVICVNSNYATPLVCTIMKLRYLHPFGNGVMCRDNLVAHAKCPFVGLGLSKVEGLWSDLGVFLRFICKPWNLWAALGLGNMIRICPQLAEFLGENKKQRELLKSFNCGILMVIIAWECPPPTLIPSINRYSFSE